MSPTRETVSRRWLSLATALMVLSLAGASAYGHGTAAGDLQLDHPYAVPSLAGVNNGAAYLRGIQNKGQQPDKLLSASSDVAARVALHRMRLDAGVMRMREVPFIALPAGQTTLLRHGGEYHLMLMDLKRPLRDGDRFDMTLNFERAGRQTVRVWVQTPRAGQAGSAHH